MPAIYEKIILDGVDTVKLVAIHSIHQLLLFASDRNAAGIRELLAAACELFAIILGLRRIGCCWVARRVHLQLLFAQTLLHLLRLPILSFDILVIRCAVRALV